MDLRIKRRNAVETAKTRLVDALEALQEAQNVAQGTGADNRRIAIAKTNIETGLLWLDSVEEE